MNKSSETLKKQEKANIVIFCTSDLKARIKAIANKERRSLSAQACLFLERGLNNPHLNGILALESSRCASSRREV